jgi:peptidoglycan hydrolase CwlO-like protein
MTMKKTISVYIIFAFLLMSFAGCGKLKDSPVSGLNQPETSVSLDNFSDDINAKKESWKEWIYRQWNYTKWYWIGSAVVVAIGGAYYYYCKHGHLSTATQCCLLRDIRYLPLSSDWTNTSRIQFNENEIDRLEIEIDRLNAEIQQLSSIDRTNISRIQLKAIEIDRLDTKIEQLDAEIRRLLAEIS